VLALELEYVRTKYASRFREAFVPALEALSARQRNLLRQHYIDGVSLEALAGLYRVHRATAARWLADARQAVLSHVREGLRTQGALTDSELESLLRVAQTDFPTSISCILRPDLQK